jgi:hypothetical protein
MRLAPSLPRTRSCSVRAKTAGILRIVAIEMISLRRPPPANRVAFRLRPSARSPHHRLHGHGVRYLDERCWRRGLGESKWHRCVTISATGIEAPATE